MDPTQASELISFCKTADISIKQGVPGAQLTTYAIGGPLTLIEPDSEVAVAKVLGFLTYNGLRYRILGAGSNLLINSSGIADPVIRLGRALRSVKPLGEGRYEIGGATALMALSRELSEAGMSGLEFAGGIPATVGGAVRMNAGAHGGEIVNCLESFTIASGQGELARVAPKDFSFAYRRSGIPADAIVVSAVLRLVGSTAEVVREQRAKFLADRKAHQPLTLPSAGSVFKNPNAEQTAGKLVEACGLKGLRRGGAQISEMHGNWIVNPERKASAEDVVFLMQECEKAVKEQFGVDLKREQIEW